MIACLLSCFSTQQWEWHGEQRTENIGKATAIWVQDRVSSPVKFMAGLLKWQKYTKYSDFLYGFDAVPLLPVFFSPRVLHIDHNDISVDGFSHIASAMEQ